jgi:hypothetical protein
MRRIILALICILFYTSSFSIEPIAIENVTLSYSSKTESFSLNQNYQQFKYQMINLETTDLDLIGQSNFKKRRRKKNDNLMLYVAGGLAVATATLILVNDPDNFTSNSTSGVYVGIAVGGTLACGMILAKYFIDKSR